MVGIVLISHSQKAAEGAVELASMMAPDAPLAAAGGLEDGSLGTSFEKIMAAVEAVDQGDGVACIMDMGSAVMTAEMVVESLEDRKIQLLDCPFVEGAVIAAIEAAGGTPLAAMQDKVEASVGADFVSGYIWRGQDLGGVSIQPTLSVSYKGFSLSAWGTAGIEKEDTKEIDLTLGYATGGFSISVTDYWFNGGPGYFHYGSHNTNHTFEAQIGYDFGPLALNWYTNFAGTDGVNNGGNRAYSSYISATVPFTLAGLEWTAEIGATPWGTDFYNYFEAPVCNGSNGFTVCDISMGAAKEIKITDSFSVPAFAKVTVNPRTEGAYFVFGLSF